MNYDDKVQLLREYVVKERNLHHRRDDNIILSENQQKTLLDYSKDLLSKETSLLTIRNRLSTLKNFGYFVKKDFKAVSKEEIKDYLNKRSNTSKPTSLTLFKGYIKLFYQWLNGMDERGDYPEIVSWIKITATPIQELEPSKLLTMSEVRDILIPACHNFMDKCLLMLLRETGGRINEILKANIEDVRFEKDRAYIKLLNSKRRRGEISKREIVLIDSFYFLSNWLRDYPTKNNSSLPLFITDRNKRLGYDSVYRLLKKLEEETKINKNLHPHLFRHSQSNDMSKILTDAELRVFGGWVKTSNLIARYTHLTSEDVNKKRLASMGRIKEDEDKSIEKEKLVSCSRCNELIDINKFKFCGKCGMSLSNEEEIKSNIKMEMLNKKVDELFKIFKEKEKIKILKEINKDEV